MNRIFDYCRLERQNTLRTIQYRLDNLVYKFKVSFSECETQCWIDKHVFASWAILFLYVHGTTLYFTTSDAQTMRCFPAKTNSYGTFNGCSLIVEYPEKQTYVALLNTIFLTRIWMIFIHLIHPFSNLHCLFIICVRCKDRLLNL